MHVTHSRLLADLARENAGIPGFGRLQTPKKLPCVTLATGPRARTERPRSGNPSGVVIRDNEQGRETALNPRKDAEPRLHDHLPVTLRELH